MPGSLEHISVGRPCSALNTFGEPKRRREKGLETQPAGKAKFAPGSQTHQQQDRNAVTDLEV